jgi:glycosyltransferase involved in cell wall biosynthesis
MIICLVTASYPYDVALEDTFLKEEVVIMSEMFAYAHIIPRNNSGSVSKLPTLLKLDGELADQLKSIKKLSVRNIFISLLIILFSTDFYLEIFRKRFFLKQIKNFKWLVSYQLKRTLAARFIHDWIVKNKYSDERIIFYTFWLDEATHGICDAIAPFSQNMKVISRAHGFDIYEERSDPPYWPLRSLLLSKIDAVFADSKNGCDYLENKYPKYTDKFHISLMGVPESGFIAADSRDNVLRIVSCSMVRKLKRIDLIMTSLRRFSLSHPEIPIKWTHFGDDTAELRISDLISLQESLGFDSNVKIDFPGYDTQDALYEFYRSNFIDCFITVSESEGTPISILEALNCGIPIIATAVGGLVDLVSEENGYLLPHTPSDEEVSEALFKVYSMRYSKKLEAMKRASKLRWHSQYNSSVNHVEFFKFIQKIAQ